MIYFFLDRLELLLELDRELELEEERDDLELEERLTLELEELLLRDGAEYDREEERGTYELAEDEREDEYLFEEPDLAEFELYFLTDDEEDRAEVLFRFRAPDLEEVARLEEYCFTRDPEELFETVPFKFRELELRL